MIRHRKTEMVALASAWPRHFRLLLCSHWTEFNETSQEARSRRPLPSVFGLSTKPRLPSWPRIDSEIFEFFFGTAGGNSERQYVKYSTSSKFCIWTDHYQYVFHSKVMFWVARLLPFGTLVCTCITFLLCLFSLLCEAGNTDSHEGIDSSAIMISSWRVVAATLSLLWSCDVPYPISVMHVVMSPIFICWGPGTCFAYLSNTFRMLVCGAFHKTVGVSVLM